MGFRLLAGLGRFLVSTIFIVLGVAGAFNWEVAKADLSGALANFELYGGHIDGIGFVVQYLMIAVPALVILGILLQIGGGLLVCFSLRVRLGATLLLLQMVPATIVYYHFWFLDGPLMARTLVLFLKNLSIIGALLLIIAAGQGGGASEVQKNKPN